MIPLNLKTWSYYYDKLPLLFKNDENIVEHFRILFDLLYVLDDISDSFLKIYDVLADDYLDFIDYETSGGSSTESDILDKIANLYGVSRDFDVVIEENGAQVKHSLHLDNKELHTLILARLIQNSYNGSYLAVKKFYEKVGLPISIYTVDYGHANIYLVQSAESQVSNNFLYMFKAGLLTIRSLGIAYDINVVQDIDRVFTWDSADDNKGWDSGLWL